VRDYNVKNTITVFGPHTNKPYCIKSKDKIGFPVLRQLIFRGNPAEISAYSLDLLITQMSVVNNTRLPKAIVGVYVI
jgi:hypothetical protein